MENTAQPNTASEVGAVNEKRDNRESAEVVCLTFTFPRDAAKAAMFYPLLPKEWEKVWCVEPKHKEMPVPAGVKVMVADFPRGGSLKDAAAILGMRAVYETLLKQFPKAKAFIKLDSDTALFRPSAFVAPILESDCDFVFVRRKACEGRNLANGCCYAMSRKAIERLGRMYPNGIPSNFNGHEDLVFSSFFTSEETDLVWCGLDKMKVSWSVREYYGADALAGHYGYYTIEQARERALKVAPRLAATLPAARDYAAEVRAWNTKLEGLREWKPTGATEVSTEATEAAAVVVDSTEQVSEGAAQ